MDYLGSIPNQTMGLEFWKSHGEMSLNVECTTYNEEWPIAQFNKSANTYTPNRDTGQSF